MIHIPNDISQRFIGRSEALAANLISQTIINTTNTVSLAILTPQKAFKNHKNFQSFVSLYEKQSKRGARREKATEISALFLNHLLDQKKALILKAPMKRSLNENSFFVVGKSNEVSKTCDAVLGVKIDPQITRKK